MAMPTSNTSRAIVREAVLAAGTLGILAALAFFARVEKWFVTGLWAFMAVWAVRTGTSLLQSTRRRALLLASILFSLGAVCGAAMYVVWEQQTVARPLGIAGAVLASASLAVAVADWRRNKPK
jgi:hypothetical protein